MNVKVICILPSKVVIITIIIFIIVIQYYQNSLPFSIENIDDFTKKILLVEWKRRMEISHSNPLRVNVRVMGKVNLE